MAEDIRPKFHVQLFPTYGIQTLKKNRGFGGSATLGRGYCEVKNKEANTCTPARGFCEALGAAERGRAVYSTLVPVETPFRVESFLFRLVEIVEWIILFVHCW